MYKSVFGRILICSMPLAISSLVMLAQDAGFKSAKTDNHPESLQILTPHEGVDFTGFSADLVRVIKQNWWAKMPSETKQKLDRGLKGKVVVGFGIQKDGQLSTVPKAVVSSGNKALDEAAVSAVRASAPFEHLPEVLRGRILIYALRFFTTSLSPRKSIISSSPSPESAVTGN
jgi:TonB family protein